MQVTLDLAALTLLLYFSDPSRNPFLFYYFFHIIIASILLSGWTPYLLAGAASVMLGLILFLPAMGVIPCHRLVVDGQGLPATPLLLLAGIFFAFSSALALSVFVTNSLSRYIERVQSGMRQHEKIIGIGQLVSGFAHQIGNPLDGVQNCLRHISERTGKDKDLSDTVDMMERGLERIEKVARRLQEFARPQGLQISRMDVADAVSSTLQLMEKAIDGKGVVLKSNLADVPKVSGDPYSVQEVVFNLCRNALDAVDCGGLLGISVSHLPGDEMSECGAVRIDVKDDGIGIPAEEINRIFEPFFTTKAERGGTGLGLGLCRMLLSEMGGRIEVKSRPGKGSTFSVFLAVDSSEAQGE